MPTHKKGRDKDKYYHLAKDQGYRSRAAFKLIQINKRFDFLSKSRVLIDLCAAPGGWCQVAAKYMPSGSIIIGVDLMPIKAIKNVTTFVSDITTAACRKQINTELRGWKADVVLCDGAPNIGAAYSKDAYVQNELVLSALRTATDHLVAGGTFCTKVYRSTDYNSLVWVFHQLFEDVQTIKPSSSRSQSSEIFLVCLRYNAPKAIDPKLLDPNHVFKDVNLIEKPVDVLHTKHDMHNKRHRTGYGDGTGVLLHAKKTVKEFIESTDPVRLLTDTDQLYCTASCLELLGEEQNISDEIRQYLADLKVLSKADFKKLLKWRQKMKQLTEKDNAVPKVSAITEVTDIDAKIDDEILSLEMKTLSRDRRDKKKERKNMARDRQRQLLGITNNAFEETGNDDLFSLKVAGTMKIDTDDEVDSLGDGSEDNDGEIDECVINDDMDEELNAEYQRFISRRSLKLKAADVASSLKKRKISELSPELVLKKRRADDDGVEGVDNEADEVDEGSHARAPRQDSAEVWFSHPLFQNVNSTEDSADNYIDAMPKTDKEIRREKRRKVTEKNARKKEKKLSQSRIEEDDDGDVAVVTANEEVGLSSATMEETAVRDLIKRGLGKTQSHQNSNEVEIVMNVERHDDRVYDSDHEDYDERDRAMTLALGTLMLRNSKRKSLVDASYNRFAFNDPKGLPDWFLDDEMKHNKPQLPVPDALLSQASGAGLTGGKEIKKVAEARARKRKRAMMKLKEAKRKATSMVDDSEMSSRQKIKAISQALRNSKSSKPSKVYVVTKKNKSGSSGTATSSGKGKLKFVDRRMKKDKRGEKQRKKRFK